MTTSLSSRRQVIVLPALLLALFSLRLGVHPAAANTFTPTGPTEIVSAGDYHTCALTPAGEVDCWGLNGLGQATDQTGPYIAVSGGTYHTCALTPVGAVDCWGNNGNGQAAHQPGPYTQVVVGGYHTCALTPDGALDCWGSNDEGEATDQPGPYTQISAGGYHTCALTPAGAVDCWGNNDLGQAVGQPGPYTQVSAGYGYNCALTPGGAVDCWGNNADGQADYQPGPYIQVSPGSIHTCALTPAGAVDCWGWNAYGQADNQTGPYAQLSAGAAHTCALSPGGAVDCWGSNDYGQADDQTGPYGPYVPDTNPPETTIDSGPHGPTMSTVAFFTFSANEAGSTLECRLDTGSWEACTSPKEYTGLSHGLHAFYARATDAAGNTDPTPAGFAWYIDLVAPETTINAWPPNPTAQNSGAFAYASSEGGSESFFDCQLDSTNWVFCDGGSYGYSNLADGNHTFRVRAMDGVGNMDNSPAEYTWVIDTVAPQTSINLWTSSPTSNTNPEYGFVGSDVGGTGVVAFECRLYDTGWEACGNGTASGYMSYSDIADGSYTFRVRAIDAAGNVDPQPAIEPLVVDTIDPTTTLTGAPPDPTNSASATFTFTGDDGAGSGVGGFECHLDYGPSWEACSSPKEYTGLSDGTHIFGVRAMDNAWNVESTAEEFIWTVDTTGPVVTIDDAPGNPSNNATPQLAFSATEQAVTFQCQTDSGGYASCSSPVTLGPLAAGEHTFTVRGFDALGNLGDAASHTWTVDTTPPDTTLTATPPNPAIANSGTFEYSSSESDSDFDCDVDGTGWTACDNGQFNFSGLSDGRHTFAVRAIDAADNTDPTPAEYTWVIDTTGPTVTLDSVPTVLSNDPDPTFAFSSEAGATFECKLDGATWAACASPRAYTALSDGDHTFEVRATDTSGVLGPVTAYPWTIDTAPPTVTITSAPPDPSDSDEATFTFTSEAGATFEYRMDSGLWEACTSPEHVTGLSVGSHIFEVRATDTAGNTSDAVTYTWTIDLPGAIYVTATGGRITTGPLYQKNDILRWDGAAWSVWFDGAAEGLPATADIMAFDVADEDAGAAWLAIRQAIKLPGLAKTQPTQIVYTNGTTWSLFFDGGDVGLRSSGERINGLEVLPGSASPIGKGCLHYLLISTVAGGGVPIGATNVNFSGEDVLGFCMTSMGANTTGRWHVVFEGQSQGLKKNNNLGLSASDDAAMLYFTVKRNFVGDGGLVRPSELISFSNGVFSSPLWRAADHGLKQVIGGIDVVGNIP